MALRIRRGLSADRTSITPEQGEFLYTTDTYEVFMGDGVTAGGKPLYTLTSLGGIGLADLSAASPLSYNSSTGQFSIQVATGSQNGYLSSANWTTFNNKQSALEIFDETTSIVTNPTQIKFVGTPVTATVAGSVVTVTISGTGGGGGLSGVSVATANGLAGVSDLNATNPTLTLSTTVTGLLKGNGTAISAATAGTDYQAALTGTGLVNSSGGTISYVTNNSSDWNTAYSQRISTFSTTGNSGAATFIGNVLNIPNYTAAGLGAIASSRTIATTPPLQGGGDLSADRTLSILQATSSQSGYLSSVDWSTFNSKQAALSGTGIVKSTAGTISYLTDNSGNWDTAFGWGNHATAGYLLSSTAATTYVPQTRSLTIDGVTQNLTADRTFTINKSLNDLTDVTLTSVAGGDLIQYSNATSQWVNVPLSALTSIGAVNGLSYSLGNVALGGTLDYNTTINTYNVTGSAQYALTFSSGSTAFTSAGAAPIKITDTTANSAGRATLYVGANDNHGAFIEGKGTPTTTAPSYGFERSSANLIKNSTIYTKSTRGVGLYAYLNPDEAVTNTTNYISATIPAVAIEKTTGLFAYSSSGGIAEQTNDKFFRNQIYNLLSFRLSKGSAATDRVPYQGIETSFEIEAVSGVKRLANLRAYRVSTSHDGSEFSISTRLNTEWNGGRSQEYEGFRISNNGVITLPAYAEKNNNYNLNVSVTGGVITGITPGISPTVAPRTIMYGDTVSLVIIDEAGTATTPAIIDAQCKYTVARVRLTNRGSGYTVAPTVTFSGSLGTAGTAVLSATGEVDYIVITNPGQGYATTGGGSIASASVTISAPASGVQATGVVEFGEGYFTQGYITSGGAGYTLGKVRAELITQARSANTTPSILGVNSDGSLAKFKSSLLSVDYLLNSSTSSTQIFGTGGNLLNTTTISSPENFTINTSKQLSLTSAVSSGLSSISDGNTLINLYSKTISNPYGSSSSALNLSVYGSTTTLGRLELICKEATSNGVLLSFTGGGTLSNSEFYMSSSPDATSLSATAGTGGTPNFSGERIGFRLIKDNLATGTTAYDHSYFNLSPTDFEFKLGINPTVSVSAYSKVNSGIEGVLVGGVRDFVDIGGVYSITSSSFIGGDPATISPVIADYISKISVNSRVSAASDPAGIKLLVDCTHPSYTGTSFIKIDEAKIYIKANNTSSASNNSVLTLINNTTGELGYTVLSTVATTGNYSDISGTPSLATVATTGAYSDLTGLPTIPSTLNDLTDVTAPSPTNGQVLSYNTTSSQWEAATFSSSGLTLRTNTVNNGSQTILNLQQGTNITLVDNGSGTVTISSSGGSGGVGLDSVFMLMGA